MSNRSQAPEIERRTYQIEVRKVEADAVKRIGGKAAIFDKLTRIGWFLERVKPGAFDSADTSETVALFNHDVNKVLGRTSANTLRVNKQQDGLEYEADVPDTATGNEVYTLVSRGDIKQSSFGFTIRKDTWERVQRSTLVGVVDEKILDAVSYGGMVDIRNIEEVDVLYDVSPVTFPAYTDTTVAKRTRDAALPPREIETNPDGTEKIVTENLLQRLDNWLRLAK